MARAVSLPLSHDHAAGHGLDRLQAGAERGLGHVRGDIPLGATAGHDRADRGADAAHIRTLRQQGDPRSGAIARPAPPAFVALRRQEEPHQGSRGEPGDGPVLGEGHRPGADGRGGVVISR
jgi:hypothetical protein